MAMSMSQTCTSQSSDHLGVKFSYTIEIQKSHDNHHDNPLNTSSQLSRKQNSPSNTPESSDEDPITTPELHTEPELPSIALRN